MANNAAPLEKLIEEFAKFPGIGRKSANVVLGDAFRVPGFPVDTHVNRVLNRIGLVKTKSPEAIEAAQNAAAASSPSAPPRRMSSFVCVRIMGYLPFRAIFYPYIIPPSRAKRNDFPTVKFFEQIRKSHGSNNKNL